MRAAATMRQLVLAKARMRVSTAQGPRAGELPDLTYRVRSAQGPLSASNGPHSLRSPGACRSRGRPGVCENLLRTSFLRKRFVLDSTGVFGENRGMEQSPCELAAEPDRDFWRTLAELRKQQL